MSSFNVIATFKLFEFTKNKSQSGELLVLYPTENGEAHSPWDMLRPLDLWGPVSLSRLEVTASSASSCDFLFF